MVQLHLIRSHAVSYGAAIQAMKYLRAEPVPAEGDFVIEADGNTAPLIGKVRSVAYWFPGTLAAST